MAEADINSIWWSLGRGCMRKKWLGAIGVQQKSQLLLARIKYIKAIRLKSKKVFENSVQMVT